MSDLCLSRVIKVLGLTACFLLVIGSLHGIEKTPFTVADSLRVKSFSPQSMTDDGRFIAGTISIRLDRLGTNHKRFRDPTYISPRIAEVVILDTEAKTMSSLFKNKIHVQSLQWSPDGNILAFFMRKGDGFALHTYDRKRERVREIKLKTKKPLAQYSFLVWSKDSASIFLALRAEGWEAKSVALYKEATVGPIVVYDSREPFLKWDAISNQTQLLIPARVNLRDGSVQELLPEERYSQLRVAEDNTFITYVITRPLKTDYERQGGEEYDLVRLNLQSGAAPKVLIKENKKRLSLSWNEENTLFAWADEGDIFIQSVEETEARNLTKDKTKPEEGDAEAGEEKDKKDEKKIRFSLIRFNPDGSQLLASTDKGYWLIDHQSGEVNMVYEFPEKKKENKTDVSPPRRRVVAWSPDGRYLYLSYSASDKWERGFMRYDLQDRFMQDLVKDSNLYRGLQMSKDGNKFFFSLSNGDLPNDLYMTDRLFKDMTQLTELNAWVMERKLTRSELIKYLDVDGKELYGVLYYPVDYEPGKKYPLVCEIYERFFDNGFNTNMNIITNQGWFGLRPSVDLEIGYPGESWVKGVTSIINKLIEKDLIEPKKLGVHGTSYGGYATSLLITQTDRFTAAINISGKVNIISFLGDSPRISTRNYDAAEVGQDRIGATLWESPLKYINHSAVMFADRINTPHLMITGEGDWNVPAGNTRELYYALRRLGKECVWVNYWNDGHGMGAAADEATYQDKWDRVIDWYKTYFAKADAGNDKAQEK